MKRIQENINKFWMILLDISGNIFIMEKDIMDKIHL